MNTLAQEDRTFATGAVADGCTRWLAQQALRPFDARDRDAAWTTLFDTLSVGVGAQAQEARAFAQAAGVITAGEPRGDVHVAGRAQPLPAAHAAALMALACHSIDYDDTYMEGGVKTHISAVVVPAAFAVAQETRAGIDATLDGICAGIEVEARLGHLVTPEMVRRWHPTGTLGPVGAAAAAARLYGLDESGVEQALGIAADGAAGTRVCMDQGDVTKSLHAAAAARGGVEAARLVLGGALGPRGFLEARQGYFDSYIGGHPSEHVDRRGPAGARVHGNSIKLFPAMHALHAAIVGVLELRAMGDAHVMPQEIVVTQSVTHARFGRAGDPRTSLAARLSLDWCVAVSWIDGACGMAQFDAARLDDPRVRALMQRVRVEASEEIERQWRDRIASRVSVLLPGGVRREVFIADPPGSPARPARPQRLLAKWRELLAGCTGAQALDAWLAEFIARRARECRELAALVPPTLTESPR